MAEKSSDYRGVNIYGGQKPSRRRPVQLWLRVDETPALIQRRNGDDQIARRLPGGAEETARHLQLHIACRLDPCAARALARSLKQTLGRAGHDQHDACRARYVRRSRRGDAVHSFDHQRPAGQIEGHAVAQIVATAQ